jgi:hypothetical protein
MNSLRIARAAVRARPAAIARPLQRRGYAEVASDKIKLSLALPHQVRITRGRHTCRNSRDQMERSGIELTEFCIVGLQVTGCVRPPLPCPNRSTEARMLTISTI